MSLPAQITPITVTAKYTLADGTPAKGRVTFTPAIVATTDGTVMPLIPVKGTLDSDGQLSVILAATDDPDWGASGFTYEVKEELSPPTSPTSTTTRTYSIEVPADTPGGTLDLATVSPVVAVTSVSAFVRKAGDTMLGPLTLQSSFEGGEDDGTGTDSTNRINLESYQRAQTGSFGEVIRAFLRRADAKAMIAWYGAELSGTQTPGYDGNRDVVPGAVWKPWAWIGAHYEANDHGSIHGHISIEVPDTVGQLQTRLEILFADRDTGEIGLDKSYIITNQSDMVVRCTGTQELRLASAPGNFKRITFSNDTFGSDSGRRWRILVDGTAESGANAGSDFAINRYDDAGNLISSPVTIDRSNGFVSLADDSVIARPGGTLALNTSSVGGGLGVLAMGNASTVPSTDPVGGGVLYVENGALKYRGSSGTVTVIAPA